jgi:type IV pilus assembly protein PilQ
VTIGGNYTPWACRPARRRIPPTSYADTQFVNLPANTSRLGGATAATLALSLFSATANRFLNLELSALEAEGKGKIVSSPRVVTADQQSRPDRAGRGIPYQVATSSGATSIQFRKANLRWRSRRRSRPKAT